MDIHEDFVSYGKEDLISAALVLLVAAEQLRKIAILINDVDAVERAESIIRIIHPPQSKIN